MELVGLLGWWYGAGWKQTIKSRIAGLYATADYFSIDTLAKTLFSPFRQISAGGVRGPIGVQMRAFFDKLISRVIGALIRIVMILVGVTTIFLQGVLSGLWILLWALVPALPFIGAIVAFIGWVPSWT